MYILCFKSVNGSIGKGKDMNFQAHIEDITRMITGSRPQWKAFEKVLKNVINLPASYDAKKYAEWKNTIDSMPDYAKKLLMGTSNGSQDVDIKKLSLAIFDPSIYGKEFDNMLNEKEKNKILKDLEDKSKNITKSISVVFRAATATYKRYEHAFTTGNDADAISLVTAQSKTGIFQYDPPEKVAANLLVLIKNGKSLSDIKDYLSSNLKTNEQKTKAFQILNSNKQGVISKLIFMFDVRGKDVSLQKILDSGKESFAVQKAKDDLRTGAVDVLDVLKNPTSFASRKKIPLSRVQEIVNTDRDVSNKVLEDISKRDVLRLAFIRNRKNIQTLTKQFIKEASDSKKQPNKQVFFLKVRSILRPFIETYYGLILNSHVKDGTVSDRERESIVKSVKKQIEGELFLAQSSFGNLEFSGLKDSKGNPISVPNSFEYPILNIADVSHEVTKNEEFKLKKRNAVVEDQILIDTEKRLLQMTEQIPPMVAQKLISLFKVNLPLRVFDKVKKYLRSGISLERFNLKEHAGHILTKEGGILMNKLLEKAIEEVHERSENEYASTVHIRAILHFSKWSGKFRSNNKWLYETILNMQRVLDRHAQSESCDSLNQLLQRKDLQEKNEPANKKRHDITRGNRKDPNYVELDEEQKQNRLRKIRNISEIRDIKARYSSKENDLLDFRNRPLSQMAKVFYAEYLNEFNTNKAFRDMILSVYVTPELGFVAKLRSAETKRRLAVMEQRALRDFKKSEKYQETIKSFYREDFSLRYASIQGSISLTAGKFVGNKYVPVRTKDVLSLPDNYWGDVANVKDGKRARQYAKLAANQSEVDFRTENSKSIPVELREKFQGYSLLGMVHRADNREELGMVMNHIYDILFTEDKSIRDKINPFQELSLIEESYGAVTKLDKNGEREIESDSTRLTDVFLLKNKSLSAPFNILSKANKNREAEIQGLNNTPGVTPT